MVQGQYDYELQVERWGSRARVVSYATAQVWRWIEGMTRKEHIHTHKCPGMLKYHHVMFTCTMKECVRQSFRLCYVCEEALKETKAIKEKRDVDSGG